MEAAAEAAVTAAGVGASPGGILCAVDNKWKRPSLGGSPVRPGAPESGDRVWMSSTDVRSFSHPSTAPSNRKFQVDTLYKMNHTYILGSVEEEKKKRAKLPCYVWGQRLITAATEPTRRTGTVDTPRVGPSEQKNTNNRQKKCHDAKKGVSRHMQSTPACHVPLLIHASSYTTATTRRAGQHRPSPPSSLTRLTIHRHWTPLSHL